MGDQVVHLTGEETSAFLSKLVTKGFLALILVFVIGLIQIFRHGGVNYMVLTVGPSFPVWRSFSTSYLLLRLLRGRSGRGGRSRRQSRG